jgi:hypothetical protein
MATTIPFFLEAFHFIQKVRVEYSLKTLHNIETRHCGSWREINRNVLIERFKNKAGYKLSGSNVTVPIHMSPANDSSSKNAHFLYEVTKNYSC